MTFIKLEMQPSFEDFMSEDKLPPVFPSSQSSNVSETVYSQHLISEACDRETYGPFGITTNDDTINLISSSLAYSPKSIPPHSPYVMDLLDMGTDPIPEDILDVENVIPICENHEYKQYLDEFTKTTDLNIDFSCLIPNSPTIPTPAPTPTLVLPPSPTPTPTPIPILTPTPSPSLITSSSSASTSTTDEQKPVPSKTRGRKRKLFDDRDAKKKDQNKEAARRYREKTKHQIVELESEESELIKFNADLRRELEILTSTHRELVGLARDCLLERRRKK